MYGGGLLFILQAIFSWQSDYVMTGKDSYWHVADRFLAMLHALFFVTLAFAVLYIWEALLLVLLTFGFYFASARAIAQENVYIYARAHTLWHVFGSLSVLYVL